jgi:hypothetical protein
MRFAKRSGVVGCFLAGLVLMTGVAQAGAAGSKQVLKFNDSAAAVTIVGASQNPNIAPPIGASEVIALVLRNDGAQFGKPSGTAVGHVLIQCTVLTLNGPNGDGTCSGIAHVPNGYFIFGGDGIFQNDTKPNHWAIAGGVGPYANDRGQIVVTNHKNGTSTAVVTLSS